MFSFSIKQLLRQPGKVILFFLLMAASTMLVVAGTILTIENNARIQIVEDTYSTVAFVTQFPVDYEEFSVHDPCHGLDYMASRPVYGDTILPEDLDFTGAKYVVEPEYRPYYIFYQPLLQHTKPCCGWCRNRNSSRYRLWWFWYDTGCLCIHRSRTPAGAR